MSSQGTKKVSGRDIQLVQNLIEQCIQLHMNRVESVNALWSQAKIERHFTELVWQKLEEENQDFFEAYNLRLALKDHISIFNELLRQQVLLMNELQSVGVHTPPVPNGSHSTYFQENSESDASEQLVGTKSIKQENLGTSFSSSLLHPYTNGMSHMHGTLHTPFDLPGPSGRIDSNTLPPQNSGLRMLPGMNEGEGASVKPEHDDYASTSQFMFGANDDVLDTQHTMGNQHIGSFNGLDLHLESFGPNLEHISLLGPVSHDLSFSNLSANYSSSDILEGSPFLGSDNFVCSYEGGELQGEENNNLENLSESLSYDDFGSQQVRP